MKPRPIRLIHYGPGFQQAYKKFPREIKDRAVERETWFRLNAHDPRLRTHGLKGGLRGLWAFSLSYNPAYRLVFEFLRPDEVLFIDVGKHNAVYR